VHWECNGLLDMYRNPKVYHSRLKEINADDMLLPLWERLVFSTSDMCALKILFCHYSAMEIKSAVLEWEVVGDRLPTSTGWLPVGQCPSAAVTELGVVSFDAPQVDHPTKARLQMRLLSEENLIAATQQEFYVFPNPRFLQSEKKLYAPEFETALARLGYAGIDDLSRADAAVVTTLNDAYREFLLRGGCVLLLAETDDALQTHIPGIGLESRAGTPWQGDWASSFGWHRFEPLPTDHVVNFAFADLTAEHVIHGFAPRDFALDVFAGLFVGWLQKPVPTIARKRVGRGELLISTFRLAKNLKTNPLANYIFYELLKLIT
jgi:hypothetical protein